MLKLRGQDGMKWSGDLEGGGIVGQSYQYVMNVVIFSKKSAKR